MGLDLVVRCVGVGGVARRVGGAYWTARAGWRRRRMRPGHSGATTCTRGTRGPRTNRGEGEFANCPIDCIATR